MSPAASPIDWDRAERVAIRIAARRPSVDFTIAGAPHAAPADIEDRIEHVTRLRSADGTATVQLIDRPTWIRANIASFRTLLAPVVQQWQQAAAPGTSLTGGFAGAQVGALLGWMSTRVLGQYDLLVGSDTADDAVYLVGPNLASLEQRFGFDPHEFRTWVLVHELTHRAQFTGVPWMRAHFTGLIEQGLAVADPDSVDVAEAIRTALRERRAAGQQVRDGGVVGLLAGPEQKAVMARIGGLMSLLEGHGDVTMTRAAGTLVPNAERFERVLHERRRAANPLNRLVMRLVGIEAKLEQYAAGARFIAAIEADGGARAVDRCWESADHLPTLAEVRAPQEWLARMEATVG